MERFKFYMPIAAAILIGLILQGILVLSDCRSTPGKAVAEFAEAFYKIDPAMSYLLCSKTKEMADGNAVENHIEKIRRKARDRGFDLSYMQYRLYHIETETHRIDEQTAEVRLTAKRRRAINPVYALVAKFFFIGETYEVDGLFTVVKEDGRWKVCGNPFSAIKI